MKLSSKIILGFLSIILISIVITSFISIRNVNDKFQIYLIDEYENKIENISKNINEYYRKNNYVLYADDIDGLSMSEDVTVRITDINGNVVYESVDTNMMGEGMMRMHGRHMQGMGMGMMNEDKSDQEYFEREFPLIKHGKKDGNIIIGFYDKSYVTQSALMFKDTLSGSFATSGLISLLLSLVLAIFLSKTFTRPILDLKDTTTEIIKGNLDAKSSIVTNTIEINELKESIEYLGSSLKKQEEIRNQYALDISHELRTPITTIQGYIEAFIDGVWEPTNDKLELILGEVNRISGLVNDLKNSFLLDSSEHTSSTEIVNLSEELKKIVKVYEPIFSEDECSLISDIQDDLHLSINKDHFTQIVVNLISNSKKYIEPKTGMVRIDLSGDKDSIVLKIADNGIGIAEKDIPNIFNRLYRVDSSRNKKTGGTGLGLAIVKSLIEKYKGSISVKSQVSEGTEFTIVYKL